MIVMGKRECKTIVNKNKILYVIDSLFSFPFIFIWTKEDLDWAIPAITLTREPANTKQENLDLIDILINKKGK